MNQDAPIRGSEAAISSPEPGLRRQVLAYDKTLMLVKNVMQTGWVGALHSHPHHQAIYVLKGHIRFRTNSSEFDLFAGDSFVIEGGVEHQAEAIQSSEVLDVFTPYREGFVG